MIDVARCTVKMLGEVIPLTETNSGHFQMELRTLGVEDSQEQIKEEIILLTRNVAPDKKELSLKNIEKIHKYLGHAKSSKLKTLIKNANLNSENINKLIDEAVEKCVPCQVYRNRCPKPAVSIPKALRPNQIVSLDLKDY